MSFICICIDGTSSAKSYNTMYNCSVVKKSYLKFRRSGEIEVQVEKIKVCTSENKSFVRRFYESVDIGSDMKFFSEGPNVPGTNVDTILQTAWGELTSRLSDAPEAKVVLVGHSRGGHIVTALAHKLSKYQVGDFEFPEELDTRSSYCKSGCHQQAAVPNYWGSPFATGLMSVPSLNYSTPNAYEQFFGETLTEKRSVQTQGVHYLGLYDAVDRTALSGGDTSRIPNNVKNSRHAVRDPELGSREVFSNTAMIRPATGNHEFKHFFATHGAIGGAVPHDCKEDHMKYLKSDPRLFLQSQLYGYAFERCNVALTVEENTRVGELAHEYIKNGARLAGVPV